MIKYSSGIWYSHIQKKGSAIVSSVIPMVLKRIGIDPAVVSAPFIATLIDGTGLIIYFKIAQYFLGLN